MNQLFLLVTVCGHYSALCVCLSLPNGHRDCLRTDMLALDGGRYRFSATINVTRIISLTTCRSFFVIDLLE